MKRVLIILIAVLMSVSMDASAQFSITKRKTQGYGRYSEPVSLAGPRFGLTVISGDLARELDEDYGVNPVITQFGWQYEKRFYTSETGVMGITEFVPLVGGTEQGKFLLSLSWLVGLRGEDGAEFAIGPNLSAGGIAIAVAGGTNFRFGALNMPVNFALVPAQNGLRFSILAGFNTITR